MAKSLGDLPLDCIASIIGRTTPLDAWRLGAVCQAFAMAAKSELVWRALLPPDVMQEYCGGWKSWREALEALAKGVLVGAGGIQKYLLVPSSGDVCRILSVAAMAVAWGQDARFWKWEDSRGSCFGKVAHLVAISWLEVFGKWSCLLLPGAYSVTWRLKLADPQQQHVQFLSWRKPLVFGLLDVASRKMVQKQLDLSKQLPKTGCDDWFEFEVGTIRVDCDVLSPKQLDFEFFVKEVDSSYWKGGLYLDCLMLRPFQQ